jgi:hypothetical protein
MQQQATFAAIVMLAACASVFAGNPAASSASGAIPGRIKIESESQLVRDYGDRIERIGNGVYQVVSGPLAGKTLSIGSAGLAYDLSSLRARLPDSGPKRTKLLTLIRQLENTARRMDGASRQTNEIGIRASDGVALACTSPSAYGPVSYTGYGIVEAQGGFYLRNARGGFNAYYAKMTANAEGYLDMPPWADPRGNTMSVSTYAENRLSYQEDYDSFVGSGWIATSSEVFSGADFSHDLYGYAFVTGIGDCSGYISVSDEFVF